MDLNFTSILQLKTANIVDDAKTIIEVSQNIAYRAVNQSLVYRNWLLGKRISDENLQDERAEYGKNIIKNLSQELTALYGAGFDVSSLHKYVKFYKLFPAIMDAVRPQSPKVDALRPLSTILPWTHYRELIRVENNDARLWYKQETIREMWSSRTLHRNIASQYYFRLLQSSNENKDIVKNEMLKKTNDLQSFDKTLEYIKNPVVAEFLGLSQNTNFSESSLETSIIDHLQKFIMEMGKGFAFVARQQLIRTDMGDYYIDLVFYNYVLKCFFLIDLKTEQISHQDVGQMDMYVRMYDKLKRTDGDNPTIGLLLCSDTSEDMAQYSVLHENKQLFQAKYLTYLPTKEELRKEIEDQKEIFRLQHENS